MMANPNYGIDFNYLGPNIAEREKLIEDGFADEMTTESVDGKQVE